MRILLQNLESGLYLDAGWDWTSTSDLARNFANTRQAAEFKIHRRLAGVFVVVLPEPTPPADASDIHDETIWETQEHANPAGRQVKAVQATRTKAGRSIQGVSAIANHQRLANRQPYNLSV